MVNSSRTPDKKNIQAAQQKRLRLIAVLGLTFVGVLYVQFFSSDAEPVPTASANVAGGVSMSTPNSTSPLPPAWTPSVDRDYASTKLTSRNLDQIVERFALATAKPEQNEVAVVVEIESPPIIVVPPNVEPAVVPEPEPLIVRAIYATPQRSAALVGKTIVRSGDDLPNGKKLISASPLGLTTKANPTPSTDDGR